MKLHGYRCDTCQKERPFDFFTADGVPSGWYVVKRAQLIFPPPPKTFCSMDCLHQWSSKQLREEVKQAEQVPSPEESIEETMNIPRHTLKALIQTALGEASMCWSEQPTGVFDSERADEIADRLIAAIEGNVSQESEGDRIMFGSGNPLLARPLNPQLNVIREHGK